MVMGISNCGLAPQPGCPAGDPAFRIAELAAGSGGGQWQRDEGLAMLAALPYGKCPFKRSGEAAPRLAGEDARAPVVGRTPALRAVLYTALPQSSAVRLCLTGACESNILARLRLVTADETARSQ